ncbi:MAG TPA: Si-specific NAD(P)(+) transhydrogenase [bacterium]|nr:Si-specific NAD(P)(+) transhydrogenase [bacterium]
MNSQNYDLLVIGSGPAGQKGAIAAAKIGKRVAVIDRKARIGGASLHGGTVPSKTLREAILFLTGFRQRSFYGSDYTVKEHIDLHDLRQRVQTVIDRETHVVRAQLQRNGVTVVDGWARFVDPHTLEVENGGDQERMRGEYILIACGSRAAENPNLPVDGEKIYDASELQLAGNLPREMIVVGAGVIGIEYASMFSALGMDVTIIDGRTTMLDFVDREIVDRLVFHMRNQNAVFRLGEKVVSVTRDETGRVVATLESGKTIRGDALLYAVGRQGNADRLKLDIVGLAVDSRGRIEVDENLQTKVPHIYAAGDVIGFPSLAASSMDQGRRAACHMFGVKRADSSKTLPYGIYTVPEISMVGKTEEELTAAKIPYEFGAAKYEELAKGQIVGELAGYLKLLFDPKTLRLLGVHAIGESAAEIIHVGQAILGTGGTIEYFRDTVFNYPTFAEAYKVAALDGLNKI